MPSDGSSFTTFTVIMKGVREREIEMVLFMFVALINSERRNHHPLLRYTLVIDAVNGKWLRFICIFTVN